MHDRHRSKPRRRWTGIRCRSRAHWVRVRVLTDEGTLVGSIRLAEAQSLYEALNDRRVYLTLFRARNVESQECEGFVAIHKGAIRSVALEIDGHRGRLGAEER